jgi:protoporphyrinogen oxidase
MTSSLIDKTSRIAIVGAGPAGLSTAWFLAKEGFHNVTVLEKLGRVGGLCKSFTVDGMSYDLGANYVTWEYQETLAIAREVGATTYTEKPYTSVYREAVHLDRPGVRSEELQVPLSVRGCTQ